MPLSGTGTTMSASAGASRASWRPRSRRDAEHVAAEDLAVRPREVDVLEDALAHAARAGRDGRSAAPSRSIDDQLARLDVAHVLGVDQVEGAGLGGDDRGALRAGRCTRGRKPQGSRAATSASLVRKSSENAPITLDRLAAIASSRRSRWLRA